MKPAKFKFKGKTGTFFRDKNIVLVIFFLFFICSVKASDKEKLTATINVNADSIVTLINFNIYGQMVENCGNCLYPGLWVGEDSAIPNIRGMRKDVIEKFKIIKTPIVRWPGGTPSEYYHWLDGVGPKSERPETLLPGMCLASPGEKNQFGTDEFIDFCNLIGAEPYFCANVGTGTPEEAANWIEYCNRTGNTQFAKLRKENGHEKPFNVKYWGIGNESYFWHTPESYTLVIQQYAKIMKTMADTSISLVAAGLNDPHLTGADDWNTAILKNASEFLDFISMHAYYFYDDYYDVVACPLKAVPEIDKMRKMIKELAPGKNIKITFDEWNIWHNEAKTYNGLMQKCTLMDGLYAAGMLHVFQRNSDIVTMANFCDLVNQLPAIVTNESGGLYVNPIYLAFELYTNHCGNLLVQSATEVSGYRPAKKVGVEFAPYIDCSATLSEETGILTLAVINRHKTDAIKSKINIAGFTPNKKAEVLVLNAKEVTAANDFEQPENVQIESESFNKTDKSFIYTFPAHSVTLIKINSKK
jgi:alpha-N-arabinofuranosidase